MLRLVGAVNDPVHAICAPGPRVLPGQLSVPAWSSMATIPLSPVSPELVTVAVTEIVEPASTLPLVALVTLMSGCRMMVLAVAVAVTVTGVWSVPETVTVFVTVTSATPV